MTYVAHTVFLLGITGVTPEPSSLVSNKKNVITIFFWLSVLQFHTYMLKNKEGVLTWGYIPQCTEEKGYLQSSPGYSTTRVYNPLRQPKPQEKSRDLFFFCSFIYLFIYWLCWVFVAMRWLSLIAASGGYPLLWCAGFSFPWLLLLWSTGSRRVGFSSCSTGAQQLWLAGSRAQAQQLWRMGLVAPLHVGSSQTRARTRVPCIGRRILNHCATREVLETFYKVLKVESPSLILTMSFTSFT